MMYCETCEKEMKKNIWHEEYWGHMVPVEEWECVNPRCGEEEEEEEE